MADLILHSRALSLYLRIATLVCEEKHIDEIFTKLRGVLAKH